MPELPEVETVKRGLSPVMEGAKLVKLELKRPDLRFPFPDSMAKNLENQRIDSLSRRAKYLMMNFDHGITLVSHLGMSGSYRIENGSVGNFHHQRNKLEAHDHVVFHLVEKTEQLTRVVYNDPRRFGFMFMGTSAEINESPYLANLGVEPTGNSLSGEALATMFLNKSTPLKSALLDQRLIAGLGNIYVCEALWRAGLSPKRMAKTIVRKNEQPMEKCAALAAHIRDVISEAIKAGGSSLRDHTQTDGSLGYFQHNFAAYDREDEPCKKVGCSGTITRIAQGGRSTFYCPTCQR